MSCEASVVDCTGQTRTSAAGATLLIKRKHTNLLSGMMLMSMHVRFCYINAPISFPGRAAINFSKVNYSQLPISWLHVHKHA